MTYFVVMVPTNNGVGYLGKTGERIVFDKYKARTWKQESTAHRVMENLSHKGCFVSER